MSIADLGDWVEEVGRPGYCWYVKRLAANDTLASNAHQAGPYIPREVLFEVLPDLNRPEIYNPEVRFGLDVDSHGESKPVRAIWYNGSLLGRSTRNEARLTGFGGRASALLDPDSTGAIAVFAFRVDGDAPSCRVWVCATSAEEDVIEDRLGPIEPKQHLLWYPGRPPVRLGRRQAHTSCWLEVRDIPEAWLMNFPTGQEIVAKTLEKRPADGMRPDGRLVQRRDCEFEVFRSVEQAFWMPRISEGFETIDAFIGTAQSILQSRKARSGRSLEYHIGRIFDEEGLSAGEDYVHGPTIEGNKKPDFLFPNTQAYADPNFPDARLRVMAVKTTCRDRWRQILNEADRIPGKHLLTLQEGVSVNQFAEMNEAGVKLVVPKGLHGAYPEEIRSKLTSLEGFIGEIRGLRPTTPPTS
jgi:hypothetical protein